ncbi:MAG: family 20 glycosylhydrolase [Clostridia bacterium]|nr:family 20 glycosylhydrolase [Clostridia bacterium]MBQ9785715.1 family 20 glycosylhydrolase [Clostridia bacterium]
MISSDAYMKDVRDIVAEFPVRAVQVYGATEENIEDFERFVENTLAPAGITHVTVPVYYRFEYRSHPEIVEAPFTSVAVAKRMSAVCHRNGITVVPEMDVPGHQSTTLVGDKLPEPIGMLRVHPDMLEPYGEGNSSLSICTRHPLLRPIVYDMIDDLMEAFDTKVIHTGFDEVLDLGKCPRCQNDPPYVLIADLVNDLNAHVRSRGGEMWMWGDRLLDGTRFPTANVGYETSLNDTARAVDLISKDVVICDWHYNEEPMGHLTPSYWATKGFRFLPCAFNSLKGSEQQIRAAYALKDCPNLLGIYLTTWSKMSDFIRLTESKIPEYQKTGVIHHDASLETSDSSSAHLFADQSSNVFLQLYVPHAKKTED